MLHMLLICWYQVVPGPRRGGSLENRTRATGNQWPMWKFLRCRSNDVLKLCEVHQRMSKWLLRCQWNDMKESVHNWVSELMNKWIDKPRNQWTSQSMTQRITEATKQWLNESSNHEPMNRWVSESKTQWTNGCTIQRVNESLNLLNQWTKEAMNQWMKQFSQIHRPTAIWSLQFLWFFSTKQILWNAHVALATVWCTFCRPHLPKVPRACQFCNILKWKSSTCYSPGRFLSTTFADRTPQLRKQRPYCDDHRSHFTTKNAGFHARECLHPRICTRLNCYTSQLLDDGWLTWWWEC